MYTLYYCAYQTQIKLCGSHYYYWKIILCIFSTQIGIQYVSVLDTKSLCGDKTIQNFVIKAKAIFNSIPSSGLLKVINWDIFRYLFFKADGFQVLQYFKIITATLQHSVRFGELSSYDIFKCALRIMIRHCNDNILQKGKSYTKTRPHKMRKITSHFLFVQNMLQLLQQKSKITFLYGS